MELSALEVTPQELEEGAAQVDPEFTQILREAAENIRAFHAKQKREGFLMTEREGVVLGQKITPLARVGIYVPGGTAAYPSTVLMNAIPAHIAGVGEIIMATPPGRDGKIRPAILAAAKLAGVTRIFKMGGRPGGGRLGLRHPGRAQGGQDRGPRQRLCGRGQAAGVRPGEHRHDCRPLRGAGDCRRKFQPRLGGRRPAQPGGARQDGLRRPGHRLPELAQAVSREIEAQLQTLEREEIARASIEANGKIIVARSLTQAAAVANRIAPEHLELSVDNPFDYLGMIENAGSIFLGRYNPEPMGDYFAGPNHTLPTMGTARFYSPLSVDDFIKNPSSATTPGRPWSGTTGR